MKAASIIVGVLLITALPYFLGSCNGAIFVSKLLLKDDIRNYGSGNAGLTNFLRVFGGKTSILVILCDALKAVLAVLAGMLGQWLLYKAGIHVLIPLHARLLAGICCELGHMFPVYSGFRGGKGILPGGFIAIMVSWKVALVVWGSFLLLFLLTRYVSAGSVSTGVLFPVSVWLFFREPVSLILAAIMGGLILWAHRSNISRLIHGTENKFTIHKKT